MRNVLTVDLEEYFHATEMEAWVSDRRWRELPSRVEEATDRVLELLSRHDVCATFFALGWVVKRHPRLARRIAAAGHEIGCHGYAHRLVYDLSPAAFREDTELARKAIEDACGVTPRLYRAASYSITERSWWALEVLAEEGFTHDSSIYPIRHDRYGIAGFNPEPQVIETASGPILEVPLATARLSARQVAPVGGGAYLRLLPYRYTAAGIRRINEREHRPACVYFHPWELDPEQPRVARGAVSRLRMYTGLGGMARKVERLLEEFEFTTLTAVYPAPARARRSAAAVR
jgi:polysaccharide deacetylase family protein (PEP-CTERM system associated)